MGWASAHVSFVIMAWRPDFSCLSLYGCDCSSWLSIIVLPCTSTGIHRLYSLLHLFAMKRPAACIIEPSEEGPAAGLIPAADMVSVHLRCAGLNVRPEFADKLVDGLKDVECRKYPLGSRGTEACTFVIRTKGHQKSGCPAVIGFVQFGQSRRYLSLAEFNADRHRHCITPDSDFDWGGPAASQLYAWEVRSHVRFATPIPLDGSAQLPARNIIGWCRPVELWAQVTRLDSMKLNGILLREAGHS